MSFIVHWLQDGNEVVEERREERLRIGRGTDADLRLDDPSVDLQHAVIEPSGQGYRVRDLGSTGGVWLDGESVSSAELGTAPHRLEIGVFEISLETWSEDRLWLQVTRSDTRREATTGTLTMTLFRDDVMAMVEEERRRIEEETRQGSRLTVEEPPPGGVPTRTLVSYVADLLDSAPDRPPTPASPEVAEDAEAVEEPGEAPEPPSAAEPPAPRRAPGRPPTPGLEPSFVDYVKAYRLPGGLAAVWAFSATLFALTLGGAVLARDALTRLASPGPLGGEHAAVEGLSCTRCHSGFRPVADAACNQCHSSVPEHQAVLTTEPSCLACHVEHRGGDALRLADASYCARCHGALSETEAESGRFAERITGFTTDHPELAVYVDADRRLRLSGPGARRSDPGGLRGFNHEWHLTKIPSDLRLQCDDCHLRDEADEIVPVSFEASCRRCHQLAFDPRFPGVETPHAPPTEVLDFLIGRYTRNREILRRLTPGESQRLGNRSLSNEEKLTLVATIVADKLLRTQCSRCHVVEGSRRDPGQAQIQAVRITERWFPHAEFRHSPHLNPPMRAVCVDCHEGAAESRDTGDLLLPALEACRSCHRPATADEADPSRLGRVVCVACHGYHAEPVEVRSSSLAR